MDSHVTDLSMGHMTDSGSIASHRPVPSASSQSFNMGGVGGKGVNGRFFSSRSKQRIIKKAPAGERRRAVLASEQDASKAVAVAEMQAKAQRLQKLLKRQEASGIEAELAAEVCKAAAASTLSGNHEKAVDILQAELTRRSEAKS